MTISKGPNAAVRAYLSTFMLLSDEVVLAIASREFRLFNPNSCVCGWALRETIAQETGVAACDDSYAHIPGVNSWNMIGMHPVPKALAAKLGGTPEEWHAIFIGVTEAALPDIEAAFVMRLDQIELEAFA